MILSSGAGGMKQQLVYRRVPLKASAVTLSVSMGMENQLMGPTSNFNRLMLSPKQKIALGSSDFSF